MAHMRCEVLSCLSSFGGCLLARGSGYALRQHMGHDWGSPSEAASDGISYGSSSFRSLQSNPRYPLVLQSSSILVFKGAGL